MDNLAVEALFRFQAMLMGKCNMTNNDLVVETKDETMEKYQIYEPDKTLQERILNILSQNGPVPLVGILEDLDKENINPPPRDIDIRHALWGLVALHKVEMDHSGKFFSSNGHRVNGKE